MVEKITFSCFRGMVVFSGQIDLFSQDLEDNSETKNKLFRNFFDILSNKKVFESDYNTRKYLMLYKNTYGDIVHFQLARKSEFNKHEFDGSEIVDQIDEDYPYVNVFVDMNTQKFIIERNAKTFENYETPASVIKNIMDSNFEYSILSVEINPIVFEREFWELFDDNKKVFNIEFSLDVPNLFNMRGEAETMLTEAKKNVNADRVSLKLSNKDGNLSIPNKDGIDSYVAYANGGGGTWSLVKANEEGGTTRITSGNIIKKIDIHIDSVKLNVNELSKDNIDIIIKALNEIEPIESLKIMEE